MQRFNTISRDPVTFSSSWPDYLSDDPAPPTCFALPPFPNRRLAPGYGRKPRADSNGWGNSSASSVFESVEPGATQPLCDTGQRRLPLGVSRQIPMPLRRRTCVAWHRERAAVLNGASYRPDTSSPPLAIPTTPMAWWPTRATHCTTHCQTHWKKAATIITANTIANPNKVLETARSRGRTQSANPLSTRVSIVPMMKIRIWNRASAPQGALSICLSNLSGGK